MPRSRGSIRCERDLGSPHRAEIGDPRGALELVRVDVVDEREHGRHRVVDPHVDRPQALLDRVGGGAHLVELGDVGRVDVGDPAELGDLAARRLQPGAGRGRSTRPLRRAGELMSNCPTDAARGAGDDDYLALSHAAALPLPTSDLRRTCHRLSRSSSSVRRIADGCVVSVTSSARSDSTACLGRDQSGSAARAATAPRPHRSTPVRVGRTNCISACTHGRHAVRLPTVGLLMDPPLPPELVAEMLDGVRDVDVLAGDPGALQPAIEHSTGGSDERVTLQVLAITRRLADEHQLGVPRPFSHHGLRGGLPKVARAAFLDGLAEVRQGGARRDRGVAGIRLALRSSSPALTHPMKPVRIGCSGWMYDDWRGRLYPEQRRAKRRWLEIYASVFDTVEVNSTFYRLARRDAVAGWVEQTPPAFLFAVKASRYLTHIKRLVDIAQGIERFYEPLTPMIDAGKLGPVLWQLPENFHRDDARLHGWLELLASRQHAIEFRHESWFAPGGAGRAAIAGGRAGDRRSSRAAVPVARRHCLLAVRPLPLRVSGSRRQLFGDRDRNVGAADRAVAPARDRSSPTSTTTGADSRPPTPNRCCAGLPRTR